MAVIDADAHVDECEDTWQYLDPEASRYRPITVMPATELAPGMTAPGYDRYWVIDGQLKLRRVRDDKRTGTTVESRELRDVPARLRHLDALGIDIQVLYPTLFISHVTSNPEADIALCRSYNRWMADRCAAANGRLRWVAMPPLLSIDRAAAELRWAKEHGACGYYQKAAEHGRRVTDPYFFPLYEEASALGLPLCIHIGSGNPAPINLTAGDGLPTNVIEAFYAVVSQGLPDRFPRMRFGFVEAGASWIPYVLDRLTARRERMAWAYKLDIKEDLFRANRLFVTCQTVEDLPYLLRFGTEDNLLIGTDYSHADASAEIRSLEIIGEWADEGRISREAARKILEDNPSAFYGI